MKSQLKRLFVLLLAVVMVLGNIPATVMAAGDSGDSGITVSVENSQIIIEVDRVGTKGTATLYRVAADEYLAGDELTGKSTLTDAKGTVVGEYSCGTTQKFTINRYLNDGSDNLYDKYYLVQNGKILAGPVYATEIASLRTKPAFEHASKKGVTLEDETTIDIAKEMGATNTVINYNLAEMIVASEDANGNPRDLSKRTDLISFVSNGKTYYFKSSYVRGQDGLISAYTKAGMNVTLVLISWAKTITNDYPRSMMYFNQTNRQTLAYNTANERGMEYWIAAMEFLADRYSKSENLGLVQKFIIGNEIDYTYDWYLLEPLEKNESGNYYAVDFDVFMEEFARTFRLANLAVKKYNSEAKVLVSLTHNWALNSAEAYNQKPTYVSVRHNSYAPKDIVDWLVEVEGARGDYNWGLAVHPYAVGTNSSNPVKTDVAGTYGKPITGDPDTTPWITVANLEMYQLYLQRPENMYNGTELRTVSLTETTVLSTKSSDPNYSTSIMEQAASIAMTYYRAVSIPCIDQMAYFQVHDQTTTNYMVGLKTSSGVKKPAYDVWKYIDTDKSFIYAEKYLKYISPTAKSYKELMPAVESDFDWDAAWDEDKIIYRKVEGGDSERSLTTNKTEYNADDLILVTAKGDLGDIVELFKSTDDISKAEPLYSYPVVGGSGVTSFYSGKTYDIVAYGSVSLSRVSDAVLKAGDYKVVLRRGDTGETIAKNIKIKADYTMNSTEFSVITDKTTYASGEDIIVSASGGEGAWVGLYKKDDVYGTGNVTSIYWYYVNDPSVGQISGKPTVLQSGTHNTDSSNPSTILAPGEYVLYLFRDSGYNAIMSQSLTITEAVIEPLTGITYKLDNDTDGFANGTVTVTKDPANTGAIKCAMYWADANGKPLEGFGAMATFKLESATTTYEMPSHMIIPEGAKMLVAYATDGNALSAKAVSVKLPANSAYVISGEPLAEFQVVSDIHGTAPSVSSGGEVANSNKHFSMMLSDIMTNSPDSIGIFASGDIANNGKEAELKELLGLYYDAYAEGTPPNLHIAVGNHDWLSGNPNKQFQKYAALFNADLTKQPDKIYYDEVVGGYHFIYLGGEQTGLRASISQEQLTWFDNLMAEITAEDPDKPVFVLLHQSFYNTVAGSLPGQGWDGVGNEDTVRAVMQKYGQIILLNGHSHWDMNSYSNMFPGDTEGPTALNTASVSYLWTSENIMGGEFLYGSQGYYVRVYDDFVVFLGRDFVNQQFLPSATYVIRRNEISGVQDTYDVYINQKAVNLGATALAGGNVSYQSSNNDIAIVTDDGTIIAKQPGTVKITITADSTDTTVISKKVITVNVAEDTRTYTVTFKNWDGSVLSENTYRYGDAVQVPAAPTKSSDDPDAYTWEFTGWDHPVVNCEGDTTYVAQFKKVEKGSEPEVPGGDDQDPFTGVVRVYGETRYGTAFDAANVLKERMGVDKFETIVVACGTDFADALSGSYLANQKNAPILLVRNRNQEINQVKDYIKANLVAGGTVYLLGGTNAIPKTMETGLDGFQVKRLAGATRYETSLEIIKEAGVGDKDILVCTGKNFADGLSASAVNMPILLVKDSLSATQKEFLATLNGNKIYIIGGTNAVNTRIENGLKEYGTTERIEGATRYYTSVNIAKKFFPDATCAVLAYADNFPDGLSGGPLAYSLDAPLILTMNGKQSVAVNYAKEMGIKSGMVLGGPTLISDKIVRTVFQMAEADPIQVR